MKTAWVSIVMGSDSDLDELRDGIEALETFGISHDVRVLSAHRTPDALADYIKGAKERGTRVIIAAAGGAAHLPGVIASMTALPVIGIPIASKHLNGLDSLLSIVQMPAGVPVATMAIGKAGARNAAILAAQIIALFDQGVQKKLDDFRKEMAQKVIEKNEKLDELLKKGRKP